MHKNLIIPVSVSVTIHAVLLFCFNSPTPDAFGLPPAEGDSGQEDPSWICELIPKPEIEVLDATTDPIDPDLSPETSFDDFVPTRLANLAPGRPEVMAMTAPGGGQLLQRIPVTAIGGGWITGARMSPGILSVARLDEIPHAITQMAPQYPSEHRRASIEGRVVVSFVVNREGRVHSIEVEESTDAAFASAAVKAVKRWRFEPGKSRGRAVSFRMAVPVIFSLSDA